MQYTHWHEILPCFFHLRQLCTPLGFVQTERTSNHARHGQPVPHSKSISPSTSSSWSTSSFEYVVFVTYLVLSSYTWRISHNDELCCICPCVDFKTISTALSELFLHSQLNYCNKTFQSYSRLYCRSIL